MAVIDKTERLAVDRANLVHSQHHPSEHLDAQIWVKGLGARLTNSEGEAYP